MDALRLPPARRRREHALRRRAPARGALPAAAAGTRPAAAGRADQPPRRGVGGVARAAPGGVQGDGRGGHARPLLPRQRRRLDPRARSRPRASPTRATTRAGSSRSRRAWPRKSARKRRASARSRRSSSGCARTPRGGAQVQGAPGPLRGAGGAGAQRQARRGADPHPARPAPGRARAERERSEQGLRRSPADRVAVLRSAARGHRRRDRRQRRGQDDAVSHDHRRGVARTPARSSWARRSSSPTSTSRATRSTPRRRCGRRSPKASTS